RLERQLSDAALDLATDPAHRLDVLTRRILQVPVDVAPSGDDRARIATTHRHDEVRPLDILRVQLLRHTVRELGHQPGDLRMYVRSRCRARRACVPAAPLVERLRHLGATCVLLADEEDVHAPNAKRSAAIASGTSR